MPTRHLSTTLGKRQTAALAVPAEITREEYRDLVNTYDSPSDLWDKPEHAPQHLPLAPRLVIPPEKEDNPPFALRTVLPPEDDEHAAGIKWLKRLLGYAPGRVGHTKLWDAYQSLRSPRLRYVADDDIRKAFRHLSWVEFRNSEDAMARYFSLLDDCIGEQIPITTEEWNTAISFAGRWVRHVTAKEVKGAVEMWMRMERHGAQADNVTFNILFDVAVKAGRFALADTIFAELKQRDMPLNRYFRTSMIYYAGMRGDGDAVRRAFRDLISAGEIVDTAVMNCVILSLVRAGEPAAGEHVFHKMKHLYEQKMGTAGPQDWVLRKELGVLLHRTAKRLRRERDRYEESFFGAQYYEQRKEDAQRLSPIKPDRWTYRILIQHHAYTVGDLERVLELLEEMKGEGLHVHGSVYVHIFRGFWQHGGSMYTSWNRRALEALWEEFLAAMAADARVFPAPDDGFGEGPEQSEEDHAPYLTRSCVHSVVRAFYKCAGKPKMLDVWADIRGRWDTSSEEDRRAIQSLVDKLVREDSVYIV